MAVCHSRGDGDTPWLLNTLSEGMERGVERGIERGMEQDMERYCVSLMLPDYNPLTWFWHAAMSEANKGTLIAPRL